MLTNFLDLIKPSNLNCVLLGFGIVRHTVLFLPLEKNLFFSHDFLSKYSGKNPYPSKKTKKQSGSGKDNKFAQLIQNSNLKKKKQQKVADPDEDAEERVKRRMDRINTTE